jgi:hypothetical protein
MVYLWRAVDAEDEVLDVLVQPIDLLRSFHFGGRGASRRSESVHVKRRRFGRVFALVCATTEGRRERDPKISSDPGHRRRRLRPARRRTLAPSRRPQRSDRPPPSPRIMGGSSSATATAFLIDSAAWSMPCVEVQTGLIERNAGLPPDRRIEFGVGIHVGDVVNGFSD